MKGSLFFILSCVLMMCTTKTDVYVSTYHQRYENGNAIDVVREDKLTNWKGYFTGINYGTTNNFWYSFVLKPEDCEWKGQANQVPLELMFCADHTYLKVKEQIVKYDSSYQPIDFKDTTRYYVNVDKRYFFKLFGDQYFELVDSISSANDNTCVRVPVPTY